MGTTTIVRSCLGNGAHFQARKGTRAQQVRNAAIDKRHGEIGRRNRGQEAENDQKCATLAPSSHERARGKAKMTAVSRAIVPR